MSSEALAWAFKQDVKPSAVKFTLVALCECASYKTGDIYPSIDHLVEITGQDRKTIIGNVDTLIRLGYIADTGERAGRTKQIKVYRACLERVPQTEPSHKRNSTVSPPKQSQIRDTEPSREPSSSEAKASSVVVAPVRPYRIPPDWQPAPLPDNVAALADLWPPGRLERELDSFRDYWLTRTRDAARPGWDKTWHNRIRDQHDRVMRENRNVANFQNRKPSEPVDSLVRTVARRQAERFAGQLHEPAGCADSWP